MNGTIKITAQFTDEGILLDAEMDEVSVTNVLQVSALAVAQVIKDNEITNKKDDEVVSDISFAFSEILQVAFESDATSIN